MKGERVLLFCCTVTETPVTAGCSDDRNSEETVSRRSAQVSGWNVGEEKGRNAAHIITLHEREHYLAHRQWLARTVNHFNINRSVILCWAKQAHSLLQTNLISVEKSRAADQHWTCDPHWEAVKTAIAWMRETPADKALHGNKSSKLLINWGFRFM